jgi:hypothetical protein
MSRRDPERIYQAHRAGTLRRLADQQHLGDERAEALIAAWEAEAASRGLDRHSSAFWREGDEWIARQRDYPVH